MKAGGRGQRGCKQYSENLSTVDAHSAIPSPAMAGPLKSFSQNTLGWKGLTRNVKHIIHLTKYTG